MSSLKMEHANKGDGSNYQVSDLSETAESALTQENEKIVTTKTIYITNKTSGVNALQSFIQQDNTSTSEDRDTNFIRKNTNRRSLNKEAYLRLHKNVTNRKSIEALRGKYETQSPIVDNDVDKKEINGKNCNIEIRNSPIGSKPNTDDTVLNSTNYIEDSQSKLPPKLSKETVESLKIKYSPSNFGYSTTDKVKLRDKPALPEKPKKIPPKPPIRSSTLNNYKTQTSYEFETQPAHEVVLRSSSEDSIEKLETFMSVFTMEPKREVKEKKRTSSFRKILTGGLFGKDKKKSEKKNDAEKSKSKKTENVVVEDNVQNEQTFNRNSTQRHTIENHNKHSKKSSPNIDTKKEYTDSTTNNLNEMEKRYAEMHINQFNRIKATFSKPENFNNHSSGTYEYTRENDNISAPIDKYIDTSSSSNTIESIDRNTYENALIAQAELRQMREIEIRAKQKETIKQADSSKNHESIFDTPPRAKETYQSVQLVKPKALIPINSERALPNPYHNGQDGIQSDTKKFTEKNLNIDEKDYATKSPMYNRQNDFDDVVYRYSTNKAQSNLEQTRQYSPNLTKSSTSSSNQNSPSSPSFSARSSPRSPTLEGSKLRLPSNREKVSLQPRIKSPIPQAKISTEKIIATELLKNKPELKKNDKALLANQQVFQMGYIDNNIYEQKPMNSQIIRESPMKTLTVRPPEINSAADAFEAAKWHQKQRELSKSPTLVDSPQVLADVVVHADPELKRNSLQYSSLPAAMRKSNREVLNMRQRSVTPVKRVPSTTSLQQSPQKHEIRQSVELYCWKEIQKLKEKQDQELKYQLQYTPYGYVEDPIIQRRSRSVEPTQQRNSRRSTSLPREVKSTMSTRNYHQETIPENRPIIYKEDDIYAQKNPNFLRTSPQRRTVSGVMAQRSPQMYEGYYTSSGDVPYRPIFNRGSLNPQIQLDSQSQFQKKVSFTGNRNPPQQQSWPTRNGYVQSPPQRRLEKTMSVGDDEVFMRDSQIKQLNEQIQKQMVKDAHYTTRDSVISLPRQQTLEESPYGTRTNPVHTQSNKIYGNRFQEQVINEPMYVTKQNRQNANELSKQKQENLQNIYGTKQQPDNDPLYVRSPMQDVRDSSSVINEPIYGSKQQIVNERYYTNNNIIAESPYDSRRMLPVNPNITKVTKQVTITNKVCDIYGNIIDGGKKIPISPSNSSQMQQTGVIYGQLQGNVLGRPPQYQSYNQISTNFVRGSRLTASANDMYRRYPNDLRYREIVYEEGPYGQHGTNFNANAPLPPTPNEGKLQFLMMRRNNGHRAYPQISDTESDTSEVRKIMNRNYVGGK